MECPLAEGMFIHDTVGFSVGICLSPPDRTAASSDSDWPRHLQHIHRKHWCGGTKASCFPFYLGKPMSLCRVLANLLLCRARFACLFTDDILAFIWRGTGASEELLCLWVGPNSSSEGFLGTSPLLTADSTGWHPQSVWKYGNWGWGTH